MTETKKQIFDKRRIRRAFDRAAHSYDAAAVLQKEVCSRLLEKLDVVKLSPTCILDAGTGTGEAVVSLHTRYPQAEIICVDISENMLLKTRTHTAASVDCHPVCADVESLPFADHSFDLVFSNLTLQWCNEVHTALAEFKRVLKPGGLLIFTLFGPDTLKELRSSWRQVDAAVHVNAFYDMHDVGDYLQSSQFADPVMEMEYLTVTYADAYTLMKDLRAIGANVTAEGHRQGLLTRHALTQVSSAYERFRKNGVLPATYEIIYGHAWQPESANTIKVEIQ